MHTVRVRSPWAIAFPRGSIQQRQESRRTAVNVLEFTLLVGLGSLAAGFLGALTGLGGGVVIVPLLTLVFKVDLRYAVGASLVSVHKVTRLDPAMVFKA